MTEFTMDAEGAISSVTAGTEFHVFDADSSKRIKKATATQVAAFVGANLTVDTITSSSANALTVGPNGATNPSFNVDASTASAATGINIKAAAAGAGVAESVVSSGTNENLTVDAKGSGTITFNGTGAGAVTVGHGLAVTGTTTGTSASASALAIGLNGATNPAFAVDASTGSQVAGLSVKGAVTGGTVAVAAIDSGSNANLTVNAKGTGTIGIGSVSTGAVTVTPATTITGLLTANGGITNAAGTASVAPLTFAAGTNLTTAAVGAVEFDGTAFYATAIASARQQLDAEQWVIATNDSATYNGSGLDQTTTPVAMFTSTMGATANGAVTLAAGKTYAFEAQYVITNTGTTSHTWAVLFGGTASFTTINYTIFGNSASGSAPATGGLSGWANVATAIVSTPASTSATENAVIQMNGILVINAGGTLIPQGQASARPGASGTPGVIVKKGSYFRIWEMAGTGTLGNWS
jgi:hypothetical protein